MLNGEFIMVTIDLIKKYKTYKNAYKNAYKNWISVMWKTHRKYTSILIRFKGGDNGIFTFKQSQLYLDYLHFTSYPSNCCLVMVKNNIVPYYNNKIRMNGLSDNGHIQVVFLKEIYKFLNVKNKIVIDIGANIADSAIYFVLNGAKQVIALEPFSYSYKYAVENIKINNMEDKILMFNFLIIYIGVIIPPCEYF